MRTTAKCISTVLLYYYVGKQSDSVAQEENKRERMYKKVRIRAGQLFCGAADASVLLANRSPSLPLPFLSATDAHFHRFQPITAQHPAGSDVSNLRAPPTPLKVNGTGLV